MKRKTNNSMVESLAPARSTVLRLGDGISLGATWRTHLPVSLLFILLSVVMTYPLINHLGTAILGWEGDGLYYVWQMWWMKHSLLDLHQAPFFDPMAYFPAGYAVANGELTPANSLVFLPVTAVWGPVVSYNVAMLVSFFASAIAAYLWIYQVTKRPAGALIGGIIFAFLPYRFAHLVGHLELMSTQWIPLTLFAFERFLAHKRLRWAVMTGVFLALIMLSSWYYAYAAALLFPVYVVLRSLPWRTHVRKRSWWTGVLIIGAATLILALPFAIPYYELASAGQIRRDWAQIDYWSLNPYDFLLPNLSQPLWRNEVARLFPQQSVEFVERQVSLGFVALALAIVGAWRTRRSSWTKVLVVLWVLSYLVALGPTLHFADTRLRPPFLPAIPLPSYVLWRWVPLASGMRVMIRFGLWTALMTAALAGIGTNELLDLLRTRWPRLRTVAAGAVVAVMVLILFESYGMVYGETRLSPRPVDQWLATQNPCSSVVELPVEQGTRSLQNYYATLHEQCTVLGPAGDSFDTTVRVERLAALRDFPSVSSIAMLRDAQTKFVLVTPSQIKNWPEYRQAIESSNSLRLEQILGNVWVYRLE